MKTPNRNAEMARSHLSASNPKSKARAELKETAGMRFVNGRLVSRTLSDPEVKKKLTSQMKERRNNPDALRAYYVKQGVLTPSGKLTKRYGG